MNEMYIEAVLFSAGKPLSIDEIVQNSGISIENVRTGLKKLILYYQKRDGAIEIAKVGSKYTMQLKPDFVPKAKNIAPTTIPKPVLKTAALIAYHQPVKQSRLMLMIGEKVYEHVKFLTDIGLVSAKKYSHTYILTTSKKFPEYFGIPTSRREDIKTWIAEKVGIKLSKTERKNVVQAKSGDLSEQSSISSNNTDSSEKLDVKIEK